ncbi:glycerophosphodiester phosphodiesterase [Gaetbulibacter aestuarii]|uniref:Glycerophosphodiester phosphodiesterase family protein n=1 Tax=Gaetbulibacter aestuarii TaxID=1502358 RepID=A0ABW7MWA0_9FLAO
MTQILKIGHRGARGYVAENTLPSFQKAIDLGADGIELDVHVCASGALVVFHDFTLGRVTNGKGKISNFTLKELKKLKVLKNFQIPTLVEVLDLVDKKCFVNVELKGKGTAEEACDIIETYVLKKGWSYSDFIISSFKEDLLKKAFQHNKNIPLAVLTETSLKKALTFAETINAKAINPDFNLLSEDAVNQIHKKGFKINVWTVNEPSDIERMKTFGVDGIITDFPDRI